VVGVVWSIYVGVILGGSFLGLNISSWRFVQSDVKLVGAGDFVASLGVECGLSLNVYLEGPGLAIHRTVYSISISLG
jgi:hypothetical protein